MDFTPSFQSLAEVERPTHLIVSAYLRKSLTFALYQQAFERLDYPAQYWPYELPRLAGQPDLAGLENLLSHFRTNASLQSLVISDPYKQIILSLLAETTPRAEQAGAVNLVFKREAKLIGDNIDGEAFLLGAQAESRYDFQQKRMVFFGCGGVSSAVAAKLAPALAAIALIDLDSARVHSLQARLAAINPALQVQVLGRERGADLRDYQVFYNGTGLGKYNQNPDITKASPILPADEWPESGLALDANYTPWTTEFLRFFQARSFQVLNGFSHMVGFVTLHLSFITGQRVEYGLIKKLAESLKKE